MATATTSKRRRNNGASPDDALLGKPELSTSAQQSAAATQPEPDEPLVEYVLKNGDIVMGHPIFKDDETPFFDWLQKIPKHFWNPGERAECPIYIYRKSPAVRNPGKFAYITICDFPVTEQDIQQAHGGGTFQLICKNDHLGRNRSTIIELEGAPKYQAGQVLVDERGTVIGPATPAAAPASAPTSVTGDQDMKSLVLQMIRELREVRATPGADTAMVTKAAEACIEMVKKQAIGSADNDAKGMDRLVDFLMQERKANPAGAGAAPVDPLASMERMLGMFEMFERIRGPVAVPEKQKSLAEQVNDLKAVFGEDFSLGDMLGGGAPKTDWAAGLMSLGGRLLENLPGMWNQFMQVRAQQLELQRIDLEKRTGAKVAPLALAAAPAAQHPGFAVPLREDAGAADNAQAQPAGQPAQPLSAEEQQRMFDQKLNDIAKTIVAIFNADGSGYQAALAVVRTYPAEVDFLRPKLSDLAQVMMFSRMHPALATIVNAPDFQEFAQEFCAGVLDPVKAEQAMAGELAGDVGDEKPDDVLKS